MDAQMTHPAGHLAQAETMDVALEGESLILVHVPARVVVAPSRAPVHGAAVVMTVATGETTLIVGARGRADPKAGHAVAAKVAIGAATEAAREARVPRTTEKTNGIVHPLKRSVQKKKKVTITLRSGGTRANMKRKGLAKLIMTAVLEKKKGIVEVAIEKMKSTITAVLNRVLAHVHVPARVLALSLVHVRTRVPLHVRHLAPRIDHFTAGIVSGAAVGCNFWWGRNLVPEFSAGCC